MEKNGILWSMNLHQPPAGPLLAVGDLLLVPTQEPGPSAQRSALYALSPVDGSLYWRQSFDHALVSGLVTVQTSEVSGTSEVLVLVALSSADLLRGEGALVALDVAGEEHWRWAPGVQRVSAPMIVRSDDFSRSDTGATEVATTDTVGGLGDVACFTADARTFVVLDMTTGAERGCAELEVSASTYAPALAHGVAYIPCRGPHLLAVGLDGQIHWHFTAPDGPEAWLDKSPSVVGAYLFAVLTTGAVLALRVADGSLAWRANVGPAGKPLSPPATDGERLFVGARDGLYALALPDGHKSWAFSTSRGITATPAVAGGVVYAACHDHHLYALDAATGRELWRYQAGRRIEVPPLPTACGRPARPCVIVADRGGTLTAVACPLGAAEYEAAGHWVEAASAYASLGQYARGAALLEAHGEPFKAAQLWEAAGERERAARQYEAAGAWQQAAALWSALGQPLQQAQALEQHARALEGRRSSDAERSKAWAAAAQVFEADGEAERAAACRREVARCLHQPIIVMDVKHEGLVLDAYSQLQFIVRNEGYGAAQNLIIRASGDQFEGQVTTTREIATLQAGRERVDWLDVRPRAYGDSVPLHVSVEYENQAGETCVCKQTIYIPVARTEAVRGTGQVIQISTAGGAVVIGDVEVKGGDFVGRDKPNDSGRR